MTSPDGAARSLRLGVYADLLYRIDEQGISTNTAFVSWLVGISEHIGEMILFGRLDPTPGRADHAVAGPRVRFVPMPYYPSLRHVGQVLRATWGAGRRWQAELRNCDAVLVFGPHPFSALLGLQAKAVRVPVVVGVRQDFPQYLARRTHGWQRAVAVHFARGLELVHQLMARGGGVVTIGDQMARRYSHGRTRVLATGVSLVRNSDVVPLAEAINRPWPGGYKVLAVGRLDPEKNPMLLLEVARGLHDAGPWRLTVAGSGSLERALAAAVEEEGLGDVVDLVGRLDRRRLSRLYREATVLIHVSHTEGQPQVLYEAAAEGLPMIATRVGGVGGALRAGERGILVPPDDAGAILAGLRHLEAEPDERLASVEAAWRWAASETLETQTGRVASFVWSVTHGQRPGRSSMDLRVRAMIRRSSPRLWCRR